MSDEIKKDRSRNYPKSTLSEAVDLAKTLYSKAGKAKISAEVAVGAFGYKGISGASLSTIGILTQYGLIDRERGKTMSVSPLAIRLIHPLNDDQELAAKRESALMPKVFAELYAEGFHRCDESLIANHLIQNDFTPDGARKAAAVFKENIIIAKLQDGDINNSDKKIVEDKSKPIVDALPPGSPKATGHTMVGVASCDDFRTGGGSEKTESVGGTKQVLATYSIPLGANEATIVFKGEKLSPEDFDALSDYVALFKKQFERKKETEAIIAKADAAISLAENLIK